jgi:hypothetical protein
MERVDATMPLELDRNARGDARIARLETIVERLATEWERERTEIIGEIRSLRKDFASSRTIPWAPIGIAASVVIAVASLSGSLIWTLIRQTDVALADHVRTGHIEEVIKVARLDERTQSVNYRLTSLDSHVNGLAAEIKAMATNRFTDEDGTKLAEAIGELRDRVSTLTERTRPDG